ncbi:hypothetical protein PILCRDRAFT_820868 [Piloderma croceum F 1598]|uniref:Uncharacterized protein n=1 Tax=Piloderma croceum (strain F 1598) TaxID=765440 RepID=A0A0C3EV44_PILCF|nr:hypothetical protein PILCRDRAFT_830201 [Piloderma croceum F 1598]KIM81982.1 hypothetical protein PILCRDRAFT_820868 [Piloderma croceum F 1598]
MRLPMPCTATKKPTGHTSTLRCNVTPSTDDTAAMEQKLKHQRERKARNQRRYYENHKAEQQEKARLRASKNRMLAKQMSLPSLDEYQDEDAGDSSVLRPPEPSSPSDDGSSSTPSPEPSLVSPPSVSGSYITAPLPPSGFSSPSTPSFTSVPSPQSLQFPPFATSDSFRVPTTHGLSYGRTPITMTVVTNIDDWLSLSASRRIAALRRWMLDMEWNWGAIADWPARCTREWDIMKERDTGSVTEWLDESTRKATAGRQIIAYLALVMEGQLPTDVEIFRDLYLQSHQLTGDFYSAVIGLELTLDTVRSQIQMHTARKCSCGKATCRT